MRKRALRTALAAIILLTIVLLGPSGVLADDTGWKDPTQHAAGTAAEFNNPNYAYLDGLPGEADKDFGGGGTVQQIYYDYGLGVPACAIVDGIEVRLDWWRSATDGTNTMSVELSWDGGGTWTTAKVDTSEPDSETTTYLGGPGDPWGEDWSPDELSDANFRVRVTGNTDT